MEKYTENLPECERRWPSTFGGDEAVNNCVAMVRGLPREEAYINEPGMHRKLIYSYLIRFVGIPMQAFCVYRVRYLRSRVWLSGSWYSHDDSPSLLFCTLSQVSLFWVWKCSFRHDLTLPSLDIRFSGLNSCHRGCTKMMIIVYFT